MPRFLLVVAILLCAAAVGAGCGGESNATARQQYIDECSLNGGRELCACVWRWFERNVSTGRRRALAERADEPHYGSPELLRAYAECSDVAPNDYVDACARAGATRSYCGCLWRWFLKHVSRERALAIDAQRRQDPSFESRETVRGAATCRRRR